MQIAGYTVFVIKIISESNINPWTHPNSSKFNYGDSCAELKLISKIIPVRLKQSYQDFLASIGKTLPYEKEFNRWYNSNI